MAYDHALAERIRPIIGVRSNVREQNMFGGLAFMVGDHMAICVTEEELLVRIDREDADRVLAEPHVRAFEMGDRTMRGFVLVDAEGIADDADLAQWVDAGADLASSLPPKAA
jgi:TfoX/Sxy family transcriptional regulator of competence genes